MLSEKRLHALSHNISGLQQLQLVNVIDVIGIKIEALIHCVIVNVNCSASGHQQLRAMSGVSLVIYILQKKEKNNSFLGQQGGWILCR